MSKIDLTEFIKRLNQQKLPSTKLIDAIKKVYSPNDDTNLTPESSEQIDQAARKMAYAVHNYVQGEINDYIKKLGVDDTDVVNALKQQKTSGKNIGEGFEIFKDIEDGNKLRFKTLIPSSNISIIETEETLELSANASGTGDITSGSNIGTGIGIFSGKNGSILEFKSLVAGPNTTISSNGNNIEITGSAGSGEANTASNLGSGAQLFSSKVGVDLQFRTLVAGPNITINQATNTVEITGSSGETNSGSNIGSGTGIYSGKNGVALEFKSLVGGQDIQIFSDSTTVTLRSLVDTSASFLVVGNTSSLSNERALSASVEFTQTDNGANSSFVLGVNASAMSTTLTSSLQNTFVRRDGTTPLTANWNAGAFAVTASTFTGSNGTFDKISGSLTKLVDGTSYLIEGSGITIFSNSNGSVTITNNNTKLFDDQASYLVLGATSSLANERVLSASVEFTQTDNGAGNTFVLGLNASAMATSLTNSLQNTFVRRDGTTPLTANWNAGAFAITASTFTGSNGTFDKISGSHTKLVDGTSYLIEGSGISILSNSNGSVTITNNNTKIFDDQASYLVLGITSSLANERVLSASVEFTQTDNGANSTYVLGVNASAMSTTLTSSLQNTFVRRDGTTPLTANWNAGAFAITASTFTGSNGTFDKISGSHTKLVDGTSYLIEGSNITILSNSNGSITISAASSGEANTASNLGNGVGIFAQKSGVDLQFKTLSTVSSLALSGVLAAPSSGLQILNSSSNNEVTIDLIPNYRHYRFFDDFLAFTANWWWTNTTNGSGAGAQVYTANWTTPFLSRAVGILELDTGTAGGNSRISFGGTLAPVALGVFQSAYFASRISIPASSSTGTTRTSFGVEVGLYNTQVVSFATAGALSFQYAPRTKNTQTWYVSSRSNAGVGGEIDSGIAVKTGSMGFQTLEIYVQNYATTASWYIDGVLVAYNTIWQHFPSGSSTSAGENSGMVTPAVKISTSLGTTQYNLLVDYIEFTYNFGSASSNLR